MRAVKLALPILWHYTIDVREMKCHDQA